MLVGARAGCSLTALFKTQLNTQILFHIINWRSFKYTQLFYPLLYIQVQDFSDRNACTNVSMHCLVSKDNVAAHSKIYFGGKCKTFYIFIVHIKTNQCHIFVMEIHLFHWCQFYLRPQRLQHNWNETERIQFSQFGCCRFSSLLLCCYQMW